MPLTGPHTPVATSSGQGANAPICSYDFPPTQQRVPPNLFGWITAEQLPSSEPAAPQSWVSKA